MSTEAPRSHRATYFPWATILRGWQRRKLTFNKCLARGFEYVISVNLHKLQSTYYYPSFVQQMKQRPRKLCVSGRRCSCCWRLTAQPQAFAITWVWVQELGFEFWLCLASKFWLLLCWPSNSISRNWSFRWSTHIGNDVGTRSLIVAPLARAHTWKLTFPWIRHWLNAGTFNTGIKNGAAH